MNPDQALQQLIEGNARFVAGQMTHPDEIMERRLAVREGQKPFAVVLACSDSRTPPLIIFDCQLGDLFIVRIAGNVAGDHAIGSMELAVDEFGVPLIMVLGHRRCGAVYATLQDREHTGNISKIVEHIMPSVEKVRNDPGDIWDNAARAHVVQIVEELRSPQSHFYQYIQQGKLKIVGGFYCIDTWQVEIITP
ncbi:carbonic anhydrase [bacterium]|nr:carbonic anhydrase [bacterium]MBU1653214.1 carbonic anhydrase [bacterium]